MPLIMNNAAHHRGLPPPHKKPGQMSDLKHHTLLPGVNAVGDDEWDEAKKLPLIKALLDNGTLAEIKPAGKKKAAKDISEFKDTEAIKLVKETTDMDLLTSWRENAKPAVLKAIDAQVEELKAPPKK